jgi:DNA-directed RNA polymerase specialized sigma24 family protein
MLRRITPRQRTAIVLTEILGYDSEQAARVMGIRPTTVRVLASQGRAALRES